MNIIVVGCGNVGKKIVEMLCHEKQHNITVVDTRSAAINALVNQFDVMGVVGNGASVDTLTDAGIKDADILITVTASDEINLLTCLIARKSGNCQTIARVRNPEYGKEIHLFKEDLGLAMVINPERAAAAVIARNL
ncbi:MAG: NAD-binding protein, partial [Clostridia bacterium]|nr:NAD-binding protein [Clostridia bacterium]